MKSPPKVLIIDSSGKDAAKLAEALRANEYQVELSEDGQKGLDRALAESFDAVVTEYRLPGAGGLQVIGALHLKKPRLPVILITGAGDGDLAIRAVKNGAYDFLPKPLDVGGTAQRP